MGRLRDIDRAIERGYDALSGAVEAILSRWWGGAAYAASCLGAWALGGSDLADLWISDVTGPFLLVALLAAGRRGSKATHAKLDELTPDARLDRAEERGEDDIEAARGGAK